MQFALRPATNRDRESIEELVFGVLAEFGLRPDSASTDADLRDIELSYRGGAFDVLIDSAGKIVGCVGLFPVKMGTCELRKMYLLRAYRGQGLGRRLLDHALQRAAAIGFSRVVLETASVLQDATRLYERYGFRPYTPEHMSQRCDKAYYLNITPRPTQTKM